MDASVLLGSRSVVLELRSAGGGEGREPPELEALILSLVRVSGAYETGTIPLAAAGIPQPFSGETWQAEWRREDGWVLRLGLPDQLFAPSFDPVARLCLEAMGKRRQDPPLGGLAVTVLLEESADLPAWLPA